VLVPEDAQARALALLEQWRREEKHQVRSDEPNFEISIRPYTGKNASRKKAYSIEETDTIRRLLTEIPHGPLSFSGEIEGLVESSNNLARVRSGKKHLEITVSYRSSRESSLERLGETMKSLGERYGASTRRHSRAPSWTARPESPFSRLVQKHYSGALGRPVQLKAFHAGLECGIFTGFAPDLQMASIGPDIHSAHTPEESVDTRSVALLWDALRRIIEGMAEIPPDGRRR
jgi:dipeptidase D